MKKQTIAIAILVIFIISFASATIVPFLSNSVTATVNIEGPIFYAGAGNILSLNEPTNSINAYNINNNEQEKFWSEEFDSPLDFYPMKIEMSVRARVIDGNLSKRMFIEFGFTRGDNIDNLCRKEIVVNSYDFKTYIKKCNRKSETENVDGFYYKIEGMGTEGVEYEVQVGDSDTLIKIDKYYDEN